MNDPQFSDAPEAQGDNPQPQTAEITDAPEDGDVAAEVAAEQVVTEEEAQAQEAAEGAADAEAAAPADAGAATDAAAPADAAAEAPAEEVDPDAEYRKRLREFTRELRKRDGKWYIIQSYSGYENKVKTNLEMRAQTMGVDEFIHEVVVPIEEVRENRDGKKKIVKRKLLPGYVLVRMELNDASWSVVRDTPGVTAFTGPSAQPTPVRVGEVAKFLMPKVLPEEAAAEGTDAADVSTAGVALPPTAEEPQVTVDYEVGQSVTILKGPFASVTATISEIDPTTGRISALVSIFGRDTPVELSADEVTSLD
ncbi:transcription termination/antitermination protein NusG [Corynebacterium ulceribovis]|uniref:transcription termination/antitermination protein NusG n=1 Tax=Corynebacterium ulceribovis TaxID=487732 RepID=UPI00036F0E97|nr:transcription termination/antitermination protein NusG [Corynebacterium ulceribovis]